MYRCLGNGGTPLDRRQRVARNPLPSYRIWYSLNHWLIAHRGNANWDDALRAGHRCASHRWQERHHLRLGVYGVLIPGWMRSRAHLLRSDFARARPAFGHAARGVCTGCPKSSAIAASKIFLSLQIPPRLPSVPVTTSASLRSSIRQTTSPKQSAESAEDEQEDEEEIEEEVEEEIISGNAQPQQRYRVRISWTRAR